MKNEVTAKSSEDLRNKMAAVFGGKIKTLSPDLQNILLDDLVTALENRLKILNGTHQNTQFMTAITESAKCETIKT
jgi:hypothetical protein